MKITNIRLTHISLLTVVMFLNTGCSFGLFGDTPQTTPIPHKSVATTPVNSIPSPSNMIIAPECSDEVNTHSPCNKGLIKKQELKPKKLVTKTGGEVHKLKSIQGQPITIVERSNGYHFPQFKGKVVLLEMFGKNCSHCIKEMPILNKLRQQYRGRLEIIALQVEDQMSTMQANALLKRHRISYPVISGDTATNLQYHVQDTFGWTGILPFMMLIKDGVTEFTYKGQITYNELNNDIRSLIK
jgi:thiol-disulfide isomerase/thioredoxin